MNLSQLVNRSGARTKRKRVGCGPGSGHGKTSCRGGKGQFARTGKSHRTGFEGGQMPLYRRLPKRGFTNIFSKEYGIINVSTLNRFSEGTEITPEFVYSQGLVKAGVPVKILGSGKLEHKFAVTAHKFSDSAKQLIEKAGGSWKELYKKTMPVKPVSKKIAANTEPVQPAKMDKENVKSAVSDKKTEKSSKQKAAGDKKTAAKKQKPEA